MNLKLKVVFNKIEYKIVNCECQIRKNFLENRQFLSAKNHKTSDKHRFNMLV